MEYPGNSQFNASAPEQKPRVLANADIQEPSKGKKIIREIIKEDIRTSAPRWFKFNGLPGVKKLIFDGAVSILQSTIFGTNPQQGGYSAPSGGYFGYSWGAPSYNTQQMNYNMPNQMNATQSVSIYDMTVGSYAEAMAVINDIRMRIATYGRCNVATVYEITGHPELINNVHDKYGWKSQAGFDAVSRGDRWLLVFPPVSPL